MSDDQHDQVLYAQFGTSSPCWRLSKDSNALELTPVTGDLPANAVIPLSPHQAAQIRRLAGITSHLILDVHLSDQPLRLHLVGKKLSSTVWAGTASAYEDTESVARDLVHGLSFAEQVVSEVNSVVVIVDRNGRIQRFNRLAEELTGMKEEDVVGRSVFALFAAPPVFLDTDLG
jgi:cyclic di-GMP phosphodiesterase Gmr